MLKYLFIYIAVINVITLVVYGIDKLKAIRQWSRVSESTLLLLAFFGGSLGALIGMTVFRHKTLHKMFIIGVPLIILLQMVCVGCLVWQFYFVGE